MSGRSRSSRLLAPIVLLAIGTVACTGGSPTASPGSPTTGNPSTAGAPHGLGTPVFGAEGWPKCLNPIGDCGDETALWTTVLNFVLPRLTQWSNTMQLEASPLIQEVPTLENGGLTESPFSVTYHLDPNAVWSDRTPITCADVDFTWKAIVYTSAFPNYADWGGEVGVSRIGCPNAQTVRLEFNKVFVAWPEKFGGVSGFILERAAFPNVDPERPDLKDELKDGIPFSGGPFVLERWSKDQAVLARNATYWGKKPIIDQVAFVPSSEPAAEAQALVSGNLDAIAPKATNVAFARQFGGDPKIEAAGGNSNLVEALWFQLDDPVMKDLRVRQAFAYAVDRDAATKGVTALNDTAAQANECGPWIPGQGPWCPATGPFVRYAYDPTKADDLLTQAGYDCSKVADGGFCAKHGRPLTVTISTTIGDVRRATTVAILQQSALAAGIDIQLRTYASTDIFSNLGPKGEFQVALYAWGPVVDPSVTGAFGCNQIPWRSNGYGGSNWDHWCNKSADRLMERSDQELDPATRAQEIQRLGTMLAEDLPMLPLFALPNVAAWRTDKLGGVDPADVSSPYGVFFGMSTWFQTA